MKRKISRALRQFKKSVKIGASGAKSAQALAELGFASGNVIDRRGRMLSAAIANPIAGANPEFVRMGAEKAIALSTIGTSWLSNILAIQRAWMNLGLVQVRLLAAMSGAAMNAAAPSVAAKMFGRATEKALADGTDAALGIARSGQAMVDGVVRPLHRAATLNAKRLSRPRPRAAS